MKKILTLVAAFVLILPLVASCNSQADNEKMSIDYEQYTLDNGLKVVLHQDHSDPIVCLAIQFHVGSNREKEGKTGFAHFFEHMLFQRSENLPRNAFFQKISAMGGDFNGGTSQDGTVYYEVVPRDALEKVLWMESDRMGFFINTVTQAGLNREIDVILNEKRQTADNRAYGQLSAILAEELYPKGHPYSWSVIGKMDDVRSATIEDVKEFYSTYYIPQNATLSLAGDFDAATAKELIQKYFGEIKKGNDIEKPKTWPAVLENTKKVVYEDPFAPQPLLIMSYPAVEQYHKDGPALDILCQLLSGSKKSPMYKTIVEANLAPQVYGGLSASEVSGEVQVEVQAYNGIALDTVYAALEKAFQMFEANGVDQNEMEMIKAMQERSVYNTMASVNNKAIFFARNTEYGGKPDRFLDELEEFKAVTAEDVMRVYNQYVKGRNFLAISMVPKGQGNMALAGSVPAKVEVENVEDASSQQTKSQAGAIVDDDYEHTPSAIDRSVEPAYMSNSPEITLPVTWSKELANGMVIKGITQTEVPLITFDIVLKGGASLDPAGKKGVAFLNAALMNEGTAIRSAEEIEQALNLLGANANAYSNKSAMGISGSCLSHNFTQVMAIVEEMLLQPRFDQTVLDREKSKVEARIQQAAMDPSTIGQLTFAGLLYGKDSFMAIPAYGTNESVNAISMDDLKAYYAANYTPKIASVIVTGDIDQAGCEKALASLAANWNGEAVAINAQIPEVQPVAGKIYFVDFTGAKQSYIIVGGPAKSYAEPDYYALDVLNFKLGSGSNGELFDVLRLQRGYTYGAYSSFAPFKNYGYFTANSSVQSTVTKESVDLFKSIIEGYGDKFTQEMLDVTKDAMLRSQAFAFETQRSVLGMLKEIYLEDLPEDYVKLQENTIKGATLEQIKVLAAQYFNDDNLTYVVVGDAKTQFNKLPGAILVK